MLPPSPIIRGNVGGHGLQRIHWVLIAACLVVLLPYAVAWNIPGHMLSGAIAYQSLRTESPATIDAVKATLEKHPWHDSHWNEQLEKAPEPQRDEMLFMLAARWADDIRTRDRAQHRQR